TVERKLSQGHAIHYHRRNTQFANHFVGFFRAHRGHYDQPADTIVQQRFDTQVFLIRIASAEDLHDLEIVAFSHLFEGVDQFRKIRSRSVRNTHTDDRSPFRAQPLSNHILTV